MTAFARRRAVTATFALLGLIPAITLPTQAQNIDDIYAKAKIEGAFVFYVGGPTAPWEDKAKTSSSAIPASRFRSRGGFSNVLDKKIDQQIAAGKLEVDTAIFQTLQDFVRWKAEGRLLRLQAAGLRRHRRKLQGRRRRVLRRDGERHALHVQHRARRRGRRAEFRARIFSNRSSAARWSRPIRPTTTRRSGCSTRSCRSTAGTTWTSTWPTSRTSSRAISASSAASRRARTG